VPLKAIVDKETIIGPDLSQEEWTHLKSRHKGVSTHARAKYCTLLHPVLHTIIIIKSDRSYQSMKTLIEVHKEGKYFVAVDLLTNVADQGLSEEVAVQNLKKGLEEHYQLLIELTPRDHKLTYLDIEVDNLVKNSSAVSS